MREEKKYARCRGFFWLTLPERNEGEDGEHFAWADGSGNTTRLHASGWMPTKKKKQKKEIGLGCVG